MNTWFLFISNILLDKTGISWFHGTGNRHQTNLKMQAEIWQYVQKSKERYRWKFKIRKCVNNWKNMIQIDNVYQLVDKSMSTVEKVCLNLRGFEKVCQKWNWWTQNSFFQYRVAGVVKKTGQKRRDVTAVSKASPNKVYSRAKLLRSGVTH